MKLLCLPDFECMFMTQKSSLSILVFRSRFGPLIIVFEPDRHEINFVGPDRLAISRRNENPT